MLWCVTPKYLFRNEVLSPTFVGPVGWLKDLSWVPLWELLLRESTHPKMDLPGEVRGKPAPRGQCKSVKTRRSCLRQDGPEGPSQPRPGLGLCRPNSSLIPVLLSSCWIEGCSPSKLPAWRPLPRGLFPGEPNLREHVNITCLYVPHFLQLIFQRLASLVFGDKINISKSCFFSIWR